MCHKKAKITGLEHFSLLCIYLIHTRHLNHITTLQNIKSEQITHSYLHQPHFAYVKGGFFFGTIAASLTFLCDFTYNLFI